MNLGVAKALWEFWLENLLYWIFENEFREKPDNDFL